MQVHSPEDLHLVNRNRSPEAYIPDYNALVDSTRRETSS